MLINILLNKQNIDPVYKKLLWYDNLKSTTNPKFFNLYSNSKRYLVLMGGGGSGKSIFAGRKILERLVTEKGHRFLVCRKVAKSLKESCFKQLCNQISTHYPTLLHEFLINKTDLKITYLPNKNEILFAGLDDVEKLKSIYNITSIWLEEASELLESDFNQLDIRLRGKSNYYKQFIITFNPISVNHWLKKRFFDTKSSLTKVIHSTYKDNIFLDKEQKKVLESFKTTDEYYYMVYCEGKWGSFGKSVFDNSAVNRRINSLNNTPSQYSFSYDYKEGLIVDHSIKLCKSTAGDLKIFSNPISGHYYTIGSDTAGSGSDNFVAQVINSVTGEQVAILCGKFEEDIFANYLYCLAKYYNDAFVGIEINYSTYPAKELMRLGYFNQYMRENVDNITQKITDKLGFETNRLTRPLIISNLIQIMRESIHLIQDIDTLYEMLSFVKDNTGKPTATSGAHDDRVMALCIAYYIRSQQSFSTSQIIPISIKTWSADLISDYYTASPTEQERIVNKSSH